MIAIDTNVLVRFLTQDDPVQARLAGDVIAGLTAARRGFLAREVVVETVWVLERAYRFGRGEIARALTALLEAEEIEVEEADRVGAALAAYAKGGAGFSDHMIRLAAAARGCGEVVTFDAGFARSPGVRLLV